MFQSFYKTYNHIPISTPKMNNLILITVVAMLAGVTSEATGERPEVVSGLSWKHYKKSCPHVESIIRNHLRDVFESDIGLAAGLLRVHFHDCFVQGCDGSVLLDGANSEQLVPPNLSLRPEAIKMIEELRALVHKECGHVVSCADIAALAARDSVYLSGGPHYEIPLGRKDGLEPATVAVTNANLPRPTSNTSVLITAFDALGLDATDLVALSGGHTIGIAHCGAFANRLYPTQDPTLDDSLASDLEAVCPTSTTNATVFNDIRTPNKFDNKYYVGLVKRQGLFTSDEDLYMDSTTKATVVEFAENESRFFEKFVASMIKMGQLSVLTGEKGEVRKICSARNVAGEKLSEVVGGDEQEKAQFVWY
ncbi:hypothetical protein V2J09_024190 [Rumex salicifolius]